MLQTLYGKAGRKVPKARINHKVWPYLYAWEVITGNKDVDDSTFRDTAITFADIEEDPALKNKLPDGFFFWACFNYRDNLREFIEQMEGKENWWRIATARAEGQKLAEIGASAHLTSERVRQICNLLIARARQKGGLDLLAKIASMRNRTDCITCQELDEDLGRKSRVLIFLLTNMLGEDDEWYFWEEANCIILDGGRQVPDQVRAYVDTIPSVIPGRDLPKEVAKAGENGLSPVVFESYIRSTMKFDGHNWHSGAIQTQAVCEDIMNSYFQDGIYIYDKDALEEFRNKAREKYGPDAPVPTNDHAMTVLLNRISMLRDRGIYVPIRSGILPPDLVARMRAYMEEHGQVSYMYNTLFGVFRDELLELGIDNRYYLQGVLRQDLGEGYTLTRDYITTNEEDKQLKDPVIQYIKDAGRLVTKDELANVFHTSPYLAYNCALMDRQIINYFGQYMHVDNLHLTDEDVSNLRSEVDALLADGKLHETKELLKVLRRKYPQLVQKAHLDAPYPVFSLLNSLFAGQYKLNRPYIALRGSEGAKEITAIKGEPGTRSKAHTSMPKHRETAGPAQILQTIEEAGSTGMTMAELHRQYHATKQYLLNTCDDPSIMLVGDRAICVRNLQGLEEAQDKAYEVLSKELTANHVVRRNRVSEIIRAAMPDFFDANGLDEYDAGFYFVKYVFDKIHYKDVPWFFHPHNRSISIGAETSEVTLMGQVTAYCRSMERPVAMSEIVNRLQSLGFNTDNLKYNLHLCEDPFLFIYGRNLYVLVESLHIDAKWLEQVREGLEKLFEEQGELIPFEKVTEEWMQENLPPVALDLSWNRYLLQQVCLFYAETVGARTIKPIGMYDFNRLHAFIVPNTSDVTEVGDAVWRYLDKKGMTGTSYTCDELTEILRDEQIIGSDDNRRAHKLDRFLTDPTQFTWNASGSRVTVHSAH